MNRFASIITFLSLLALAMTGCRDEESIRFPEFEDGANVRVVIDPNASFFNFEDLNNAKFAYDVYSENRNIEEVNFYAYFVPVNGGPQQKILLETFTQADFDNGGGQLRREYTAQQMVDLFGLGSIDELEGGDAFNFRNVTTVNNNGEILEFSDSTVVSNSPSFSTAPRTITPNIIAGAPTTSFTCCFSTFVGCPSNIGGVYNVVTTGTSTDPCCPVETTVAYTTTLTKTSATEYTISDFSSGLYTEWYCAPYGLCAATFEGLGGNVLDVCGTLTLSASYWGNTGTGSLDPETGVITLQWQNQFGDAGTSVLTPQ